MYDVCCFVLGGFYRHLYEQKLGSDKSHKTTQDAKDKTPEKKQEETKETHGKVTVQEKQNKQRNYRKRKLSDKKLSEGEIEESESEINFSNLDDIRTYKKSKVTSENIDADSDFSIDESSDEDNCSETKEGSKKASSEHTKDIKSDEILTKETNLDKKADENPIEEKKEVEQPKVKVDIWKKRTVGEVFEQALKRYYERKASRGI